MSDLIDRQAAISAICNACGKIDCDKMDKCEKLQLPPANSSEFPNNSDTISRQAAIDALEQLVIPEDMCVFEILSHIELVIGTLPSAQPERDIPIKSNETTDTAWGIPNRQAVCPKCDYYLGHVVFLGDGKGKKVTYCETCGQAIDWEGWDSDE